MILVQDLMPKLAEWHIYGNGEQGRFVTQKPENNQTIYYLGGVSPDFADKLFSRILGFKEYEIKDHLGNVRVAITDYKLPTNPDPTIQPRGVMPFAVDERAVNDYYPFGMLVKERSWTSENYRYGYNGKENDNEVKGTGNSVHFEYRDYDPRVGRFNSIDPQTSAYSWQSPYVYHRNNPINYIDYLGLGDPPPPTTLYHNTEAGKSIVENGFNGSKYGIKSTYNWFTTTPNDPNSGRAGTGVTLEVKGIDVSKVHLITRDQTNAFTQEAMKELGYTKDGLKALQKTDSKAYGQAMSKINGVMWTKVGAYMDKLNKGAYLIEKNGHYAVSDALANESGVRITKVNGSSAALNAFKGIKLIGRTLMFVAVAKDVYEIHNSGYEPKTIVKKAGFWAGAWTGGVVASSAYAATGLDLTGPWGWAGHAGTTLVGGMIGGFTGEVVSEKVYNYVTIIGVEPGAQKGK